MESGNREQARAEANAALKLAPNRDCAGDGAGSRYGRGGETGVELDKTFPLDTLVQRYWLPTIRAAVALERKDPNRAIELLKVARTIELSSPTELTIFLCHACHAYLRLTILRTGERPYNNVFFEVKRKSWLISPLCGGMQHRAAGRSSHA